MIASPAVAVTAEDVVAVDGQALPRDEVEVTRLRALEAGLADGEAVLAGFQSRKDESAGRILKAAFNMLRYLAPQ